MIKAIAKVTEVVKELTGFLLSLVVFGVVVQIIFGADAPFDVIKGLTDVVKAFSDGFAGLLALLFVVTMMEKK